jgi:microcystin-dependent protein
MSDVFVGQIQAFGFNFAPVGWALCQGQLLNISSNAALFSLLGTTFGGNGQTTFGLPDLRGRVSNSQGQGLGLANYAMGELAGTENVTLNLTQIPAHNHLIALNNSQGTSPTPSGNVPAGVSFARGQTPPNIYAGSSDGTTLKPTALSPAGGSLPHSNLQPYLTVNFCIALQGMYPSRS